MSIMVVKWPQLSSVCSTKLHINTARVAGGQVWQKQMKEHGVLNFRNALHLHGRLEAATLRSRSQCVPLKLLHIYYYIIIAPPGLIGSHKARSHVFVFVVNITLFCQMLTINTQTSLTFKSKHCSPLYDLFLFLQRRPRVFCEQCEDALLGTKVWFQLTDSVSSLCPFSLSLPPCCLLKQS